MRIPSELIKQELVKFYKSARGNGDQVVFIDIKSGIEIAAISINFDFIDVKKRIFYGMQERVKFQCNHVSVQLGSIIILRNINKTRAINRSASRN